MEWVLLLFILYSARIMLKKQGGRYLLLPLVVTTGLFIIVMNLYTIKEMLFYATGLVLLLIILRMSYNYITHTSIG